MYIYTFQAHREAILKPFDLFRTSQHFPDLPRHRLGAMVVGWQLLQDPFGFAQGANGQEHHGSADHRDLDGGEAMGKPWGKPEISMGKTWGVHRNFT